MPCERAASDPSGPFTSSWLEAVRATAAVTGTAASTTTAAAAHRSAANATKTTIPRAAAATAPREEVR